jgi:putative transposase
MARTARASVGGMWYHALNRRNRREAVFHKPGDYEAFVEAITDASVHLPVDLLEGSSCVSGSREQVRHKTWVGGDISARSSWAILP